MCGGYQPSVSNEIQFFTIASTGNGTDFGDLSVNRAYSGACADSSGGVQA